MSAYILGSYPVLTCEGGAEHAARSGTQHAAGREIVLKESECNGQGAQEVPGCGPRARVREWVRRPAGGGALGR